jgi:4'-phosphopantetheinyl transferase
LRFNLSSSDDTALLAVAWNREIGVDVEKIRAERDCMGIAERFFSPWEAAALRRLPDQQRVPAFYRCWTRKEAYVKATGEGMFLPLDSFAVPVDQPHMQPVREEPAAVFPSVGEVGQERWTMIDVPEIAGFAAAVVVESGRAHSQHSAAEQRDLVAQFLVVRSPAGQRAQRLRHAEPSR